MTMYRSKQNVFIAVVLCCLLVMSVTFTTVPTALAFEPINLTVTSADVTLSGADQDVTVNIGINKPTTDTIKNLKVILMYDTSKLTVKKITPHQQWGGALSNPNYVVTNTPANPNAGKTAVSIAYTNAFGVKADDFVSGADSIGSVVFTVSASAVAGPIPLEVDTISSFFGDAPTNKVAPDVNNGAITVVKPVVSIQVDADSVANGGTLQMVAQVSPEDATDKSVTWSVENQTGSATITEGGLLTATSIGTVKVTATAKDGSGVSGSAIITITDLPPSDGLTDPFFVLSAGNDTVTPQRAQNTPQYQTEVDYTVDTITVTPTAAVGTIKVNGNVVASGVASGAINLNVGANPITITVQEDGKAAKTYTITVTRLAANANANLNDLTVDGNSVANFDSAVLTYNVKLPFGTTVVPTVVGTATDAKATVQVTPATNLSGTEIERTTTVTVTAQDGTTKKTYKVIFEVAKQFTVTANKTTVGNRQHVTVNVANAGVATSATIILALYDTSTANVNDMKALIFKEGPIAGGNNPGILTGGFIVPTNYTIKAFVWDDFNSQKALSDVAIP